MSEKGKSQERLRRFFQLGNWKGVDGINWKGEGCGWGTFRAGDPGPGLYMLIPRCLLDTRWRCQVYFFTSLDLIFFLSPYGAVMAFIHVLCSQGGGLCHRGSDAPAQLRGEREIRGSSFSRRNRTGSRDTSHNWGPVSQSLL